MIFDTLINAGCDFCGSICDRPQYDTDIAVAVQEGVNRALGDFRHFDYPKPPIVYLDDPFAAQRHLDTMLVLNRMAPDIQPHRAVDLTPARKILIDEFAKLDSEGIEQRRRQRVKLVRRERLFWICLIGIILGTIGVLSL